MNDQLSEEEFSTLIRLEKQNLWSGSDIHKKLQDHIVNIVPANFYSDIPLIQDTTESFEYKEHNKEIYNYGIFNKNRISAFNGREKIV